MISASRAAASRLVGAAASRGPTVARHQVRNFQAFPEGLTVLGLGAAGHAPFGVRILWERSGGKKGNGPSVISAADSRPISGFISVSRALLSHTPCQRGVLFHEVVGSGPDDPFCG